MGVNGRLHWRASRQWHPASGDGDGALSLAFFLAHEVDVFDAEVLVDGFAHVVEGEAGDGDGGEGLHLDAGAGGERSRGRDAQRSGGRAFEVDLDVVEREGVAEGDQLIDSLGGQDACQPRRSQRFALGQVAGEEAVEGVRGGDEVPGREGLAMDRGFLSDIDHACPALGVEVGEGGVARWVLRHVGIVGAAGGNAKWRVITRRVPLAASPPVQFGWRASIRALTMPLMVRVCFLLVTVLLLPGCIERTISITSEPSGALVYLNDEEVGRTPLRVPFTFYGVYDVRLERDGFTPLHTQAETKAPWWEAPGPDLVAELVSDKEVLIPWHFEMAELAPPEDEPLVDRARQMRALVHEAP